MKLELNGLGRIGKLSPWHGGGRRYDEALILWFDDIGIDDVSLMGGKKTLSGDMYLHLAYQGVAVLQDFAILAYAYRYLLKTSGWKNKFVRFWRIWMMISGWLPLSHIKKWCVLIPPLPALCSPWAPTQALRMTYL